MKKFLVATALVLISFSNAWSQYGFTVTYQYGFSGKDLYSSAMKNSPAGINARLSYFYDDYLSFSVASGYYIIPFEKLAVEGVQTAVSGVNLSVIPVTVGCEFSFLDQRPDSKQKVKPYVGLDLGYALTQRNKSALAPAETQNNMIIAPMLGINIGLTNELVFNANVRNNYLIYTYRGIDEYTDMFSLVGVNAGITYTF